MDVKSTCSDYSLAIVSVFSLDILMEFTVSKSLIIFYIPDQVINQFDCGMLKYNIFYIIGLP
jgi:hypothetical protein